MMYRAVMLVASMLRRTLVLKKSYELLAASGELSGSRVSSHAQMLGYEDPAATRNYPVPELHIPVRAGRQ